MDLNKISFDKHPVETAEFLRTLAHALRIAGWTWPVKPLETLAAELVVVVPRKSVEK